MNTLRKTRTATPDAQARSILPRPLPAASRCPLLFTVLTLLLAATASSANALTPDQLQALTAAVTEMCETPTYSGERFKIEGTAGGGFIVRAIGANLEGEISRETWQGIQQIRETQPDRLKCVVEVLRELAPKMEPSGAAPPAALADPSDVIHRATSKLSAMQGGNFDLGMRLSGISDLRLLATKELPLGAYEVAADILINYIKTNLPDRKKEAPHVGITEDRGMYIAEDIHQAFKALQDLRRAGGIEVKLAGLNFDNVSLAYLDLDGFNLSFSSFRNGAIGPSLTNVNFSFADFHNTAIWNADLSGSNFHKAQMSGVKMMNPTLHNTNIEEAFGLGEMRIFCNPTGLNPSQRSMLPTERCR